MSFTAEQLQNCKKIIHEEFGQYDFCDDLFYQVMSKKVWQILKLVLYLSPET